MIALAAYRPHRRSDILGRLVCWWTQSEYSHCELVVDGICYSSSVRDGGVRSKRIDLSKPWWHVIPLPSTERKFVLSYYEMTKGRHYGWLDLICSQILRLPVSDSTGDFCSEWCAAALGLPEPKAWSPGMLVEYFEGMK